MTLRKTDGTVFVYSNEEFAQRENFKMHIMNGSSIEIRMLQLVQSTEQTDGITISYSKYSGDMAVT